MEKVIRDGKVAVLYSPGYGAGWYTSHNRLELVFHPALVKLVIRLGGYILDEGFVAALPDMNPQLQSFIGKNYSYDTIRNLEIAWIPLDTIFRIDGKDGKETILLKEYTDWITA